MTIEKKFVVGIDDIKSIRLQCNKCPASFVYCPNRVGHIPRACVQCGEHWHESGEESAILTMLDLIAAIKKGTGNGFKIKFEFDAP